MADSYWKAGTGWQRRRQFRWPSPGQVVIQAAIAATIALVWGALFIGFLWLTGSRPAAQTSSGVELGAEGAEVTSTGTPTPAPTNTRTPRPSDTPTTAPTPTPEATAPAAPGAPTDEPTVELSPTTTPTETPLASTPTPTETGPPPTDTPELVDQAPAVSFSQDVFPILERRCIQCHGGPQEDGSLRIEEGLDMRAYASLLEGSWNGPVIEPADAEGSYLVELIVEGKMPKKGPRLLPGEIRTITGWIQAGAPEN